MSKEFHVFTHQDTQYEQAFVFEVERHEKDELVEFKDLYMITTTSHGELKTRLCFDHMIQSIIRNEGGNIDDNSVDVIVDMFKELIPKNKHDEIMEDLSQKEIKNIDPDQLIKANDYAVLLEKAETIERENNEKGSTHNSQ